MGGGAGEKRDFDTQLRYLFDPTQKTGVTEYTTSTERAHEGVAISASHAAGPGGAGAERRVTLSNALATISSSSSRHRNQLPAGRLG